REAEEVGAPDRQVVEGDDGPGVAVVDGAQLRPRRQPDVAEGDGAGAGDQEAGELAAGHLLLGGGLVGEVPLPDRLLAHPAPSPGSPMPNGSSSQPPVDPPTTSTGPRAWSSTTVYTLVRTSWRPNRKSRSSSPRRVSRNSSAVPNQ